jgi:hypothetical protein
MAIARGAGTEIIRSAHFEDVDDTTQILIVGEQHHIYTVLSVIFHAAALNADADEIKLWVTGYDSKAGTTAQPHYLVRQEMSVSQTYVWNDKFSFNGFEPTDFSGPMDSVSKQNSIADQGSSVAQKLECNAEHGSDNIDVMCTYIDQNNA